MKGRNAALVTALLSLGLVRSPPAKQTERMHAPPEVVDRKRSKAEKKRLKRLRRNQLLNQRNSHE